MNGEKAIFDVITRHRRAVRELVSAAAITDAELDSLAESVGVSIDECPVGIAAPVYHFTRPQLASLLKEYGAIDNED